MPQKCKNNKSRRREFDYIICGAGASGSTLAFMLSRNLANSVLVLDRGVYLENDPDVIQGTAGTLTRFRTLNNDNTISREGTINTGLFAQLQPFDIGKGGPGGSMLHMVGNTIKSDHWDQLAETINDPRWSYDALLPVFKYIENFRTLTSAPGLTQAPEQRSQTGFARITQLDVPLTDPVGLAATRAFGTTFELDYNVNIGKVTAPGQNWVIPLQPSNLGPFLRVYGGNVWLPPSVMTPEGRSADGARLRVQFSSTVSRLLFEDAKHPMRATGIEYVQSVGAYKRDRRAYARKAIILAGGTHSPAILERSGIGSAAILERIGVEPKIINEHVGNHLITNYGTVTAYSPVNFPPQVPGAFVQNFTDGGTIRPDLADGERRIQLSLGGRLPPQIRYMLNIPLNAPLSQNWLMQARSEGTMHAWSIDPLIFPQGHYNCYSDGTRFDPQSDISIAIVSLKLARAWAHEMGVQILWPPESHFEGTPEEVDAQLDTDARLSFNITNDQGTCRMAQSAADGVTDTSMRVHGLENVYVGDNTTQGVSIHGATGYAAYTVAAFLARELLGGVLPTGLYGERPRRRCD